MRGSVSKRGCLGFGFRAGLVSWGVRGSGGVTGPPRSPVPPCLEVYQFPSEPALHGRHLLSGFVARWQRWGHVMQQSPQVVFAAEDVAAAELQPFRYAGVDSQTSTEFKWVVWKEPAHITLVYAWTISGGVTGKSGKQRKRKAASGLGALLAALRHHHGPDDTAQLEVGTDYQEWRRVDSGSGTAEERLKAIEYLEKRLGVASGGSWNDALALQEGAKRPADGPPAGRPGKAPCRGEAQGSGQGKAPAASSRVSGTCRLCPLLNLLSSQAQGPGQGKAPAASSQVSSTCVRTRPRSRAMANPGELSSACSPPPPALLGLLSSACSPIRLLSYPPALLRLLASACHFLPALFRSHLPSWRRLLSWALRPHTPPRPRAHARARPPPQAHQ